MMTGRSAFLPTSAYTTLNDICNGAYVTSMQIGVTALIPQLLSTHPETKFIRVVGTDNSMASLVANGLILGGVPNDGVVPTSSLSNPSLPGPPTMSFPLTHIQLECDPNVIREVGAAVKARDTGGQFDGVWIVTGSGTYVDNENGTTAATVSKSLLINGLVIRDVSVTGGGNIDGSGNGIWTDSLNRDRWVFKGKFLSTGTASGTWTINDTVQVGIEIITGSGTWSATKDTTQ
jgi:hypothetical protein